MFTQRRSGILLHPTSLPSSYGIGDLGASAHTFLNNLKNAGQTLWQILPLCPVDQSGSPYQSASAFAGEPLLLSPELLMEDGLLTKEDLEAAKLPPVKRTDYKKAKAVKLPLLKKAFAAFEAKERPADYEEFLEKNADWLEDYALFTALKAHFSEERAENGDESGFEAYLKETKSTLPREVLRGYFEGAAWNTFPKGIRKRDPRSIRKWSRVLSRETEEAKFYQYAFGKQWQALREAAHENGISIIGDAPIFLAFDSADVWANQKLFLLDSEGFPTAVAGVPPDCFSETGQLWGNPLYAWKQHAKTDYEWWLRRIEKALSDVDILRLDHFRGFDTYWKIPFGAEDATGGTWEKGPSKPFFDALEKKLGSLPIIAEDLGTLTESAKKLREDTGFPGMRILQFAFGADKNNPYLPHSCEKNTVIYTGTHDNDTTKGWYETASEQEKDHFRRYMNVSGENAPWDLIRLAFSSPAVFAVIPLQDVFGLGTEDRMNLPGTAEGNWGFSFSFDLWTEGCTEGLLYLSELFGRNGDAPVFTDVRKDGEDGR